MGSAPRSLSCRDLPRRCRSDGEPQIVADPAARVGDHAASVAARDLAARSANLRRMRRVLCVVVAGLAVIAWSAAPATAAKKPKPLAAALAGCRTLSVAYDPYVPDPTRPNADFGRSARPASGRRRTRSCRARSAPRLPRTRSRRTSPTSAHGARRTTRRTRSSGPAKYPTTTRRRPRSHAVDVQLDEGLVIFASSVAKSSSGISA